MAATSVPRARGFEEDAPGIADQSPAGFGHQAGDDEGGDGVSPHPAGQDHKQASDGGGDEREQGR